MKTVTVKLSTSTNTRLERAAKQRGQTKSDIIREALETLFSGSGGNGSGVVGPARSALDLAGDLVGCIEGPGDLSTNPAYMDGLGE